ncbi:potassium channel family protein [Salipiger mucosus]|uniref:Potassium voltage-gated channel subfamily KQT, possible potassium channel, VIC family n=1 Tax=Salipiger mucosus DSM 16094 TaxID=1123237 RepID=S9QTK3_9RHOB|nr:potassium channel family protein [Salipiger mucosus]EPX82983.1 Potassium voltage-gated channel subfamily KQT, possible potassium channel, VIC family [Salipiger mucosus DSM 16094]
MTKGRRRRGRETGKDAALERLRNLYEGSDERAHRFRTALLFFDIATVLFVIATSFTDHGPVVETIDAVVGVVLLADFAARFACERRRLRFLVRPVTIADMISIVSFLAPLAGEGLGFLRVVRTLRLLHTYQLLLRLRRDYRFFRENEEVIVAALNLIVFIFVMTGLVYATQYRTNPQIGNYADALYFTVTALTTTGFGDITLTGTLGRTIAVVVMICGVTLFLRLAQVLFRPTKVRQPCETCGLLLHDADAVHCKHCGAVIRIETEGLE